MKCFKLGDTVEYRDIKGRHVGTIIELRYWYPKFYERTGLVQMSPPQKQVNGCKPFMARMDSMPKNDYIDDMNIYPANIELVDTFERGDF